MRRGTVHERAARTQPERHSSHRQCAGHVDWRDRCFLPGSGRHPGRCGRGQHRQHHGHRDLQALSAAFPGAVADRGAGGAPPPRRPDRDRRPRWAAPRREPASAGGTPRPRARPPGPAAGGEAEADTAVWDRRQYGVPRDPRETETIPGAATGWGASPAAGQPATGQPANGASTNGGSTNGGSTNGGRANGGPPYGRTAAAAPRTAGTAPVTRPAAARTGSSPARARPAPTPGPAASGGRSPASSAA